MSDEFTTRLRQVADLTAKEGDSSTANILLGCAMLIDRQARTIRRLRALADDRRKWRKLYQGLHAIMESLDEKAEDAERARIVAAIRKMAARAERDDSWNGEQCCDIADAIERGEL